MTMEKMKMQGTPSGSAQPDEIFIPIRSFIRLALYPKSLFGLMNDDPVLSAVSDLPEHFFIVGDRELIKFNRKQGNYRFEEEDIKFYVHEYYGKDALRTHYDCYLYQLYYCAISLDIAIDRIFEIHFHSNGHLLY